MPVSRLTSATLRLDGGINLRTICSLSSALYLVMVGSSCPLSGGIKGADIYRDRGGRQQINGNGNPEEMIEPYGSTIKALLLEFRELDLGLDRDAEYELVLANSACSLTFQTERHYLPSLAAHLSDSSGRKFEIGLSRKILAGEAFRADAIVFDGIRKTSSAELEGEDQVKLIRLHVEREVRQVFDFVLKFSREMLDESGPFRHAYQIEERKLLDSLGL